MQRPEQLAKENDFGYQSLPDGSVLTAWSSVEGMFVQRETEHVVTAELRFSFPRLGLGGGRLVVSPHGRHAVVSYFSGQSEEAFELIGLDDGLQCLAHPGYTSGETSEFGFSPDEDVLVAVLPYRGDTWWPYDDHEFETTHDGRRRVLLGQILVHTVATGDATVHELTGVTDRLVSPENTGWVPRPIPEVGPKSLRLPLPWGRVELRLPLPAEVLVNVP